VRAAPAALGALLATPAWAGLPERLSDTGLDAPGVRSFEPRFPLWSDGAAKRRWIWLPPGTQVDAGQVDAWRFPPGTRLWKEFSVDGRRIETRHFVLGADGRWEFASYVWTGDEAFRAPDRGQMLTLPGGKPYAVPSTGDCQACHAGARSPVLGFAALQLGPAVPALMREGLLRGAPAAWAAQPPDFSAADPAEHAARGYLHGNCGHCHFEGGVPVPLRLSLDFGGRPAPLDAAQAAQVLRRAGTRNPYVQMPPLGTREIDPQGLALLHAGLALHLSPPTSTPTRP
jgi:mono/diheme cytochrome c family protein